MKLNTRKLKGFIFRHKLASFIIVLAFLLSISAIVYEAVFNKPLVNLPELNLVEKPKETRVPAPLTGLLVDKEMTTKRPLAVVIENSPDARPQSGYAQADVVYETLAEGGITRTLAIFQSQSSDEIGPVRSARPYFIDWMSEINAMFVHVGGSIDALDYIASTKISDLNQFYFGKYFWRATSRYAPHNVYTTSSKLFEAATSVKYETSASKTDWYEFKTDLPEAERPVSQKVTVNFSSASFVASYDYDPKTNEYLRSVGGAVHKDKVTGEQLRTKNIVVLYQTVGYGKNRDGVQKVDIGTIGSGNGLLFQDGTATKITWSKANRTSLTKLKDATGNDIKLNPGKTWIEVVPTNATVSY